ncbi:MAG: NAD(P)/FAD-dependent oxidoreductase [Vulcanococcus sp.]
MIGAGVVGFSMAWHLQGLGHQVTLIAPELEQEQGELSGSQAALGLLMAQVYRRSSGRGWRLRQQSLALWQRWRQELEQRGHAIPARAGLLQLATTAEEVEAQKRLCIQRQEQGFPLRLLSAAELAELRPTLPQPSLGGLVSPLDGQIDPGPALEAFRRDGLQRGLSLISSRVMGLQRGSGQGDQRWQLDLEGGTTASAAWVVVCAGLSSPALLATVGHQRPQSPVLGQAAELQLHPDDHRALNWPGSLSWGGINLVPRPNGRLWLGATLEPDRSAPQRGGLDDAALQELLTLNGHAPAWLKRCELVRHWHGLRARPSGRPAPLLELLEPGLLLASGHYRNGVLLAPASAHWAGEQIAAAEPGAQL